MSTLKILIKNLVKERVEITFINITPPKQKQKKNCKHALQ